mmetsp:Transcript_4981/g.9501  ORF Transcript_4981/g.9501 Transcript_4981/m.9501 type:complete len:661 (-) Transcript_4981:124-2106(-)
MAKLEHYHHPNSLFEETGTTFSFLVFGSAAVIWGLLEFQKQSVGDAEPRNANKYEQVNTEETVELTSEGKRMENKAGGDLESKPEAKGASAPKAKPKKKKVQAVTCTRESISLLMKSLGEFGGILLYSWFCENRPIFEHATKSYSRDIFWFITLIYMGFAFTTMKANPKDTSLLNREQTEEWKGWMQFLFLMYHYFHASEVYNSIRVFISCYVWMTGFGNFSFFYIKRDFGFVRFWQMMWRLNFLVFWLMMVHGNTFILYYINPLHTFYFLMVYVAMAIFSSCNHDKYPIRWKLLFLGILIFVIWDIQGIFHVVFGFLPTEGIIGATHGVLHEWHFRSGLDHYSALFGMVFALNYPLAQAWLDSVEEAPPMKQWLVKGVVLSAFVVMIFAWASEIFFLPKPSYNEHHPYFFWIPLIGYVFIRNCSKTLRSYHLGLLTQMGKITLETYLMQHHVWLTSNAKTLLVIIPGYPLCNFFFVSCVYLIISHRLFRLTVALRAMLIPNDLKKSLELLFTMVSTLAVYYGLAKVLCLAGGYAAAVVTATVLLGIGGYFLVGRIIKENSCESVRKPYLGISGLVGGIVIIAVVLEAIFAVDDNKHYADSSGGVAQNAGLGMMVIIVFAMCVFLMDNYGGLSYLANLAGCLPWPTWEQAYSKLHHKIFG